MTKEAIRKAAQTIRRTKKSSKDRIHIYEEPIYGQYDKKLNFQVNWASIGSQTPAVTESFAKQLLKAAKDAKAISGKFTYREWLDSSSLVASILNKR